ncbi:MAG: hypothetical protein WCQ44_11960, partial [Opitutaceae bacterium]
MKTLFSALVLFSALLAQAAPSLEETFASQGRLILAPFASAPFPHPERAAGHTYQGRHFPAKDHYADNTVALFIPHGFRPSTSLDFVIHFHGWTNTVASTLRTFQLVEQIVASNKNAILVIPEGPYNAPDSFGGKLEDADGFKRFMAEVIATLRTRADFKTQDFAVGRIILSAHSGGYRVIQKLLQRISIQVTQKTVGKALSRWLPIVGPVLIGGYSLLDTRAVGKTAIDTFSREIEIEA